MPYTLRDGLSFCQVDGQHFIFLDVASDRYFQLADPMERAFAAYMKTGCTGPVANPLIEKDILMHTRTSSARTHHQMISLPSRSALEQSVAAKRPHIGIVLEVVAITWWAHRQLKKRALKKTLDRFTAYREGRTSPPTTSKPTICAQHLAAADQFRRARIYVPIDTCCLPDSLAMASFLARRGLHAHVVIAVSADPFAAHAWVQVDDVVLNESVGTARAYAPIRVI
jgi:hypothetical protein